MHTDAVSDRHIFPSESIILVLKTQTANESENVYLLLNSQMCHLKLHCNEVI